MPNRTVVLDGALIDNRLGFYCAIGEAVNGPGGYFGRSLLGFDDCLFGGFGLDFPYTIIWKNAAVAEQILGAHAYLEYLEIECLHDTKLMDLESFRAWKDEEIRLAKAGQRTLFSLFVRTVESVSKRSGKDARLILE